MDTAVALVQAYLQVNGYFTVTEYPVLEALHGDQVRTVTDLDMLAFRFAAAGHDVVHGAGHRPLGRTSLVVDPVLGCPGDRADMIVGEVKEGKARLNPALRDPAVLEVALTRFGCCPKDHAQSVTRELIKHGHVLAPAGHTIRMVAFGDSHASGDQGPWHTVPMGHVVQFLQEYLREYWPVLRHAQLRDPTFAVLALIEKWSVGGGRQDRVSGSSHQH
jgi:hypothetical protein